MSFNGFSRNSLDFLVENRIQNSKEWFNGHKTEYNLYVLDPLRELVRDLTPTMLDIDPLFTVDPTVNKTISRIYRDVRFSKDKSLYRDEMWITFMRNKRFWEGLPGFYFVFGPDGLTSGVGYYEASTESMDCYRQMILKRDKSFKRVFTAYKKQNVFALDAQRYKRTKFPNEPDDIRAWLDLRNLNFSHKSTDFDLLYSQKLVETLTDQFDLLKPMYEFICAVEERKKHDNLSNS